MIHSTRRRARRAAAIVGTAGIALASACGSGDHDAPDVTPIAQIASDPSPPAENGVDQLAPADALDASIDAMQESGAFTVRGTTKAGSTIDMAFQVGVGAQGTVTTDSEVRLVAVEGSVYVTGDPAVIAEQIGDDVDETIADKWLLVPSDSTAGFRMLTGATAFTESVLRNAAATEVTSVRDLDGRPAVGILFDATGATLWVAADGEPTPLQFDEKGATGDHGVLTFGDYGGEVDIAPPDPDNVVDPSEE